ncbi:MAG: peptidoglycan DD-metalloendopeptidase family protein [Limnobacter sp.]|nr:peptidoglycan DD-metalloendopeptidase family protein [Limnobacter sp.]
MKRAAVLYSLVAVLILGACSTPMQKAPVVDRSGGRGGESSSADGTYIVKSGDTLYAIALEHGMDWRELARLNNIDDPNKLAVGQKLKVDANSGPAASSASSGKSVADSDVVEVTPIPPSGAVKAVPSKPVPLPSDPASASKDPAAVPPAVPPTTTSGGEFMWPHNGAVIQAYKAGINKGVDFLAKVGDPVVAAGAGKVVYSGNALRGYGNLIIIKHENKLLTAYAHNKTLLVKEGEVVKKGQKIAEAGQSDTDKPKVHFEVRKNGNPVDPIQYLPAR